MTGVQTCALPILSDVTKPPQPISQIEPPISEHIEERQKTDDERANREAEIQKERERLAEDQRRMEEKQRQAEAQQAKEAAERELLETRRAESSRERAREEERKRQEAERRAIEQARTVESILERFRQAYENRDLATIQSMSRMSDERLRNVHVMFDNYETIQASIKDLTQTDQGASATLFLESVTSAKGERVTLSPLARKSNLKISRQGTEWEKIIW